MSGNAVEAVLDALEPYPTQTYSLRCKLFGHKWGVPQEAANGGHFYECDRCHGREPAVRVSFTGMSEVPA